jgi:hypothetical protein
VITDVIIDSERSCAMAFTFRILFSGISAFVPDKPFAGTTPPHEMTVLFPNALKPSLPAQFLCDPAELERRIVAPHYPVLQFNLDNLQTSGDQFGFFAHEKNSARSGIASLLKQDIIVSPDGRPLEEGSLRLIDGEVSDPENVTEKEEQYLRWLKKMSEVLKAPATVNKRFLGPLSANENDIVTRIRFSNGRLSTAVLSPGRFEFVPINGTASLGTPQRLATHIALEFEAERYVKLVFRNFGPRNGTTKLVFGPADEDPYREVVIRLENLEPEEILGVPRPTNEADTLIIDPDFAIYYRLVEGLSNGHPVLVPRSVAPPAIGLVGGPIGGSGKPCSPLGIDAG